MAIPIKNPGDEEEMYYVRQVYLESLLLQVYKTLQNIMIVRNAQYEYLRSRNPRVPRRQQNERDTRNQQMLLVDSDLSRTSLPDLVFSAVQQMPPPPPQVTASAPNSPARDASFQFPEFPVTAINSGSVSNSVMSNACSLERIDIGQCMSRVPSDIGGMMVDTFQGTGPAPTPRPQPRRRRLTSEGSLPCKVDESPRMQCNHGSNCTVHNLATNFNEREWVNVGANLRNIADEFHEAQNIDANVDKSRSQLYNMRRRPRSCTSDSEASDATSSSGSTDSLLSTLISSPFRDTLWTTLAFYLGWRLVTHLR